MTRVFNSLLVVEPEHPAQLRHPTAPRNNGYDAGSISAALPKPARKTHASTTQSPTPTQRGDTSRAMSAPLISPIPTLSSFARRGGTPAPSLAPAMPQASSSGTPRGILTRSSRSTLQASVPDSEAERAMSVPISPPIASPSSKTQKARSMDVSKRHTRKCARNPKFLNVLPNGERPTTAYFMSSDRKAVDEPPMEELLKKLPPLQVGDLYCHQTPSVTLIWIYLEDKDKMQKYWERIDVGYVRELDGRMLSLTASGNPNFVGDEWANKRQNTEEKRKRKGKEKRLEEMGDESDELESEDD